MTQQRFDSYVICTSPRSGSTLLCDLLAQTNVAGRPGSHFHRPSVQAWAKDFGVAAGGDETMADLLDKVLDAAKAKGTTSNGVFGLRLQRGSFSYFMDQLAKRFQGAVEDPTLLDAAFGRTRLIYLTRADKVEQAVSFVRAQQSGLWHRARDGTEIERLAPMAPSGYDRAAIASQVAEFEQFDQQWEAWFAKWGLAPCRLSYTELSAEPLPVLGRILFDLGLDPRLAQSIVPGVAKLSDATNRDWVARFRSE